MWDRVHGEVWKVEVRMCGKCVRGGRRVALTHLKSGWLSTLFASCAQAEL